MMDRNALIALARQVRENAYAPYSGFKVGACLLTVEGRTYTGCNVENTAMSPTCCAERSAVFQAVAQGERNFTAIAIAAGKDGPVWPCGVCLQVLAEFSPDMMVITAWDAGGVRELPLRELLPHAFYQIVEGTEGSCRNP
jgi:cytidine deaminase